MFKKAHELVKSTAHMGEGSISQAGWLFLLFMPINLLLNLMMRAFPQFS